MRQPAGQVAQEECDKRRWHQKRQRRWLTGDMGVTGGDATTSRMISMRGAVGNKSSSICAATQKLTKKKGSKTRLSSQQEVMT